MGLGRFRSEASVPCVSLSSDSAPLRDVQSLRCPEVRFEDMARDLLEPRFLDNFLFADDTGVIAWWHKPKSPRSRAKHSAAKLPSVR